MELKPGWLQRQIDDTNADIATWPAWMRREMKGSQTMNSNEQRQSIGKPYLQKLKDLGMGLTMDRVLGDRVLIMPIDPFTEMDKVEKAGLLFIPDSARETNAPPPTTGEVVMIGPDVPLRSVEFKGTNGSVVHTNHVVEPGEVVMFSRFAGMDIMLDNVSMKLVHVNEIACVLAVQNPEAIDLIDVLQP